MIRNINHEAEIHKALFSILNPLYPTYDALPTTPNYPFIVLGEPETSNGDVKNIGSSQVTFNIHLFSNYHGKKEIYQMVQDVITAINNLDATPIKIILLGYDVFYQNEQDEVKHAIIRLRLKTYE